MWPDFSSKYVLEGEFYFQKCVFGLKKTYSHKVFHRSYNRRSDWQRREGFSSVTVEHWCLKNIDMAMPPKVKCQTMPILMTMMAMNAMMVIIMTMVTMLELDVGVVAAVASRAWAFRSRQNNINIIIVYGLWRRWWWLCCSCASTKSQFWTREMMVVS